MKILSSDLIAEYHKSIQDKYPELTLKQVTEICASPFLEVKKGMEGGEFPTMRLKYFGTFLVYPNRIKAKLKFLEIRFKENTIEPEVYFKLKARFEKYLKRKENEGKDNLE